MLIMFVRRILFWRSHSFSMVVAFVTAGVVLQALQPLIRSFIPATDPERLRGFWKAALGDAVTIPLLLTAFVSFNVCELINVGIRKARCDPQTFRTTVWPSFPVCILSPMLGILAARYVLVALGIQGAIPFGVIAIAVAIPLNIVGTHLVISHTLRG